MSEKSNTSVAVPDFGPRSPRGGGVSASALIVAGAAVLALLAVFVIVERGRKSEVPTDIQPPVAYAAKLPLSNLEMSEASNLLGGKSTFLDGIIQNTGNQTVTDATVQVIFRNDEGLPPQITTRPLTLIRTRVPSIDTQAVAASPLKPGDQREFRLIFEAIAENWNQQIPEIRIIRVQAR